MRTTVLILSMSPELPRWVLYVVISTHFSLTSVFWLLSLSDTVCNPDRGRSLRRYPDAMRCPLWLFSLTGHITSCLLMFCFAHSSVCLYVYFVCVYVCWCVTTAEEVSRCYATNQFPHQVYKETCSLCFGRDKDSQRWILSWIAGCLSPLSVQSTSLGSVSSLSGLYLDYLTALTL